MKSNSQGGSRYNYRTKRKKTNLVLNSLIGVVLLLIVFVAYSIFSSGNDNTAAKKDVQTTAEKTTAEKTTAEKTASPKKQAASKIEKDTSSATKKSATDTGTIKKSEQNKEDQSTASDEKNSDKVQTVDSPDTNSNTQASTSPTGQHATSYDTNSQDWQEMLQAMSSATGIDQGNMTVWFLGSDRSTPNGSVGTISAKDTKQKFRVNLQWQDGKGWTATNVEQIQ